MSKMVERKNDSGYGSETFLTHFSEWIREIMVGARSREKGIEDKIDELLDKFAWFVEYLCEKGVLDYEEVAKQFDHKPPKIVDNPFE